MSAWWEDLVGLVASGGDISEDSLLFEVDGEAYEVPAAGQESHTVYGAEGISVFADLDGDGKVDQVSSVGYDGSYQVFEKLDTDRAAEWGWEDQEATAKTFEKPECPLGPHERGHSSLSDSSLKHGWECVEWG